MRSLTVVVLGCLLAGSLEGQVWKGDAGGVEGLAKAAEGGDAAAMADMAFLSRYARGGVAYDQKLIFDYSRKSAKVGNAFGMAGLSFCYMNACGVTKDGKEAHRWAKKSADLGHPCGILRLGVCYDMGLGVPRDHDRSIELFRSAAEAGSVNARTAYAGAFVDGEGVPRQRGKGVDMLMEVVREHDWSYAAEVAVRVIRKDGLEDLRDEDLRRAMRTLEKGSQNGNPRAMWFLAHEQKDQLDRDVFLNRIITAARMGQPRALENLRCYLKPNIGEEYDFPVYGREVFQSGYARMAYLRGYRYTKCGNIGEVVDDCIDPSSKLGFDLELAERLCREWILKGHGHYHSDLAGVYCRGVGMKDPKYNRPELAIAHAIYNCRDGEVGAWWLLRCHEGKMKGFPREPAKALVVAKLAVAQEFQTVTADDVREIEAGLSGEELQQAKELEAAGYPTAAKFRERARDTIIKSGFPLLECEAAEEVRDHGE